MTPPGFPHSDIPGSRPACGSPGLFAACHVLPRFPAPRHPPSALSSLTTISLSLAVRPAEKSLSRLATLRSSSASLRLRLSKNAASSRSPAQGVFAFPWAGGDDRIRTGDPLLAKQVLS